MVIEYLSRREKVLCLQAQNAKANAQNDELIGCVLPWNLVDELAHVDPSDWQFSQAELKHGTMLQVRVLAQGLLCVMRILLVGSLHRLS